MSYSLLDIAVSKKKSGNNRVISDSCNTDDSDEPSTSSIPPAAPTFTYKGKKYTQLDPQLKVKPILRDVERIPEYQLIERNEPDGWTLSITLRLRGRDEPTDDGCIRHRQRMVELLFEEIDRHSFIEEELAQKLPTSPEEDSNEPLSIQEFYNQLRLRHRTQAGDKSSKELVIPLLRPELRLYQEQAIRWLLKRETVVDRLPGQYVLLRCRAQPEVSFYMDLYDCTISDKKPNPKIPAGGILADEMGMGKTVEILGLMLLNPKKQDSPNEPSEPQEPQDPNEVKLKATKNEGELRCLCASTLTKKTIACRKCGRLQHRKCVLNHFTQPNEQYICPECWRTQPMVKSGATIIVSPASIKHQWESEIRKHVTDPNFRVFIYNGIADKWISPQDLAAYDVVLTDYTVLSPEIYRVPEYARSSRHEQRFLKPSTPLTMIHWWRVVLDEAQMVESVNNNAAKMVKALPTKHRWAVTGTPIEKTINNLHGLVSFLDYEPYSYWRTWKAYAERFQQGNAEPLLTMMARVMWRTCKHSVFDQLDIPPQTERIHHIQMSDLQNYFYRCEHLACAQAFNEKARRIGANERMAQMNIATLNQLLEPLRKLRQDCTIPSVLGVGQSALQGKKLLTPAELHEHLIASNVNECKGKLRSVVSSLNGMAAVEILQEHYDQAFRLYQASLRCADDYQGAISVDSLLQIHALHNLLDLVRRFEEKLSPSSKLTAEQIAAYEERRSKLEGRYIEQYANKVRSIEATLRPATEKVDELINGNDSSQRLQLVGEWWRDLFALFEESPQRHSAIQSRVLLDQSLIGNTGVNSWRTLDLWLVNWLDGLLERRSSLVKGFQSLGFFVEYLQPDRTDWSQEARARIDELVRTAFACHLDPALFEEDEFGVRKKERQEAKGLPGPPVCLLCKVKDKLNELESALFQIRKTQVATGGLWQVSRQESVLKLIHAYAKRLEQDRTVWSRMVSQDTIVESDRFIAFLEHAKVEFKEYSQYWVEINYTVAAYDELTMCKSRLQLLTLAERREIEKKKKKPSPLQVLECELADTLAELQLTKAEAERDFVRLKGTRKYLEHLGSRKELEPCPICHSIPEGRYAVLQCGHHLCSICLMRIFQLARAHGNMTTCGICRHEQHVKDIQYVQPIDPMHKIRGNFSNKVSKIVQTALELVAEDPSVKIVIFSHWEPILTEVGVALAANDITLREKSAKFYQCVADFKDPVKGITCLLLPLRFGSKGLNLTEATHVFLVEPILNPGEEMQAIGRVHRIGQTRPTFVHRFIMLNTIETTIHETIQGDRSGRWWSKDVTVEQLAQLFRLDQDDGSELPAL
ncbi:E3 ubiquitin-protein ligase SHPRH [Anopheles gambiae]|uniref:E3 ubiquitin-protein ligase SHPRH n=1 Tax=Anopheles gambiae TaxID=7165 RepID=UPI002AC8C552|nr:E3 ubiquitin-protein ligase SHPRH [Anopheles gambiae]